MARFWEVFQIGLLSMFFAEVMAASFPLWFINPFGWLVTFPLYLLHTVFLINIAQRLKLHKISQYYLLGTMFGLYEAWLTKVLWSGYGEEGTREAILGLYGEIAVFEFVILVFFYHPIFSFILPILTYQRLHKMFDEDHTTFLDFEINTSVKTKMLAVLVFVFAVSIIVFNNQFNLLVMLLSVLGSCFLVFLVHLRVRSLDDSYEPGNLIFGSRGFIILIIVLVIMYILMFLFFVTSYYPEFVGYVIVLIFYLIPIVVLSQRSESEIEAEKSTFSMKVFDKLFRIIAIAFFTSIILLSFIPMVTVVLVLGIQLIFLVAGPILYVLMLRSATR